MVPFQILWYDGSGNQLISTNFPVGFPGETSLPIILEMKSNAAQLQTYETLTGVKFFLVGNPNDIDIVQNIWPSIGGTSQSGLNGGYDISFDQGRTFTRFDSTHGVYSSASTWIELPATAVGTAGATGTIGAFDAAHIIVRVVVPPGAVQYQPFDIQLGVDFDII